MAQLCATLLQRPLRFMESSTTGRSTGSAGLSAPGIGIENLCAEGLPGR